MKISDVHIEFNPGKEYDYVINVSDYIHIYAYRTEVSVALAFMRRLRRYPSQSKIGVKDVEPLNIG